MRVLLTGASGFIGRALVRALEQRGHSVVRIGSRDADFGSVPSRDWWGPRLRGVDAVVNAVGILREQPHRTFQAVHAQAPAELFHACADASVRCVVQISALGADEAARSRYHLSKKAADDVLRALPLRSAIVQPSLVYGPGGGSALLFNRMAAAPAWPLPQGGRMRVQPVHVDDVAEGIARLLEAPPAPGTTIVFSGAEPLSMRDYLQRLRRGLGIPGRLWVPPLPVPLFRAGAAVAGRLPGSMLDAETADMLLRGNAAPSKDFARLLGRPPRALDDFVAPAEAAPMRTEAVLGLWLPVLRVALALMWLWTAAVSFGLYPVQDSLALLARVGLHGTFATIALYGAAVLDLLLGALTLWAPPRWRRAVWSAQLALIGGYMVLITLFLPEFWLHPYGPILKNLPILAAIALLRALEPAHAGARAAA
jgi:uncharacterized protein YbjT (DUF2867 family)